MEWAREASVRWKPRPCVCCGSGREVTLSLTGKKNGSRTECRSTAVALCGGAISSCRVAQKNRGGASCLCAVLVVSAAVNTARRLARLQPRRRNEHR